MTLNIAHRGASGYEKENTMPAFQLAVELGCDGIETDVQLSKDGIPVLIHDETVDRTTQGKGYVKDKNREELEALGVPTLECLLKLAKEHKLLLNLELKNGMVQYPELEEKVIALVESYQLKDHVIISSFNHHSMVKCKQLEPHMPVGLLYIEPLYQPEKYACNAGAQAIHPHYLTVDAKVVKEAHDAGIQVNVYTVNEEDAMLHMLASGVDMVITNYPDRFHEVRKVYGEEKHVG